jgi:hypothetical protein
MTEQPEKKKPPRKLGETFFYIFPQSAWPGRSTPGEPIPAKTTEVPGLIITPHDGRGKITATLTHANTGLAIGTDYESPQDADRAASAMAKAGMDWTVKNKGQLEEQRAKLPADVKAAMEVLANGHRLSVHINCVTAHHLLGNRGQQCGVEHDASSR